MRFATIFIFSVASRLVALATAKPIPIWNTNGMAIPLSRHPSFPNPNKIIDLDAIISHGISVREKIISGLDNYEMNTGTTHPYAVKRSERADLRKRGTQLPLTSHQDNVWMGEISIGTPPQTFKVNIDTGSADMWVLQTGCSGIAGNRDFWDPHLSESAEKEREPFRLKYDDGTIVVGDLYTDNITIAGFTADSQTFGSVTFYTSVIPDNANADGILGLAFPSISNFYASPLFASLIRQKKLINPIFSLKLSFSGGEMFLGGANSMLYKGDITYTPVTHLGFWQVSMNDVRVNGDIILENVPAVLDAGANLIYGDRPLVSELYGRLGTVGGTLRNSQGFDFHYLPCDSFPTVSFTIGGKTFAIPPGALILDPIKEGSSDCFSAIVGDHLPSGLWTVGIPFLQGVYSVFDYGTAQVGFAELA